ncbi:MAG: hypothetical protein WA816_09365 [Bacteroidales bacterium]
MKNVTKLEMIKNFLNIFEQKYPLIDPPYVGSKTKKYIADLTEMTIKSKGYTINGIRYPAKVLRSI